MKPGDRIKVIFTSEYPEGYPAEGVVVQVRRRKVRVARFVPFDGLRVKWYRKRDVIPPEVATVIEQDWVKTANDSGTEKKAQK